MPRRGNVLPGALAAVVLVLALPAQAAAVPPPPPNPGDDELRASSAEATRAAERVGSLANQVAEAEAAVSAAQLELSTQYDAVTAAQRDVKRARTEAEAAQVAADNARLEVDASISQLRTAQRELDRFAAASFRQGSTVGSLSAYIGADSPKDLLSRSSLLNAVSDSGLDAREAMQRAVTDMANADSAARAVREEANRKEQAATQAEIEADRAYRAAVANETAAQLHSAELLERKQSLDAEFAQAQQAFAELEGRRRDYTAWQARKRAEQAAAAQADPPASSPANPGPAPIRSRPAGGVVAPTYGVITSTYGPRWGVIHYGLDIANSIGTPIVSVSDGVVISSGPASGFGLWVRVRHDNGIITVYGHINENLVSVGQRVAAGQLIATVGNRGQSTGPHLHLEVLKNGSKIDPLFWLRANGVSL